MSRSWEERMRSIIDSRSEEHKGNPISVDTRGAPGGKIDPENIDDLEVSGGVVKRKSSGHPADRHEEFKEAGLDPEKNPGYINTSGDGDDRIAMKEGTFEGDVQEFKEEAASLDIPTDHLDTSGRQNGVLGSGTESADDSEKDDRSDRHAGDGDATQDDGGGEGADVDLNEWGHEDYGGGGSSSGGSGAVSPRYGGQARSRRPDGAGGSSVFGGSGSSGSGGGSGSGGTLSTVQKGAMVMSGAVAVGALVYVLV